MPSLSSLTTDNRLLTLGAAIAAFLVFAVLILLLVRLVFGNRLRMSGGRGRQQRLGVVDAYDMDRQRQLVLVRRDNTEHLIMIGGPNDLLIESSIVRVEPREARERQPASARESLSADGARIPVPDTWALPAGAADELAPAMPLPAAAPLPSPPLPKAPEPTEGTAEPTLTSDAEPAAAKPRDFITRMRGRSAPPTPATEPTLERPTPPLPAPMKEPPAPLPPMPSSELADSAPPLADADFFETEIAKALAPSMRGRPAGPPPLSPPPAAGATDAPPEVAGSVSPPPLPPRVPFRPFPARRDAPLPGTAPTEADEGAAPRRPIPVRPPPPPFFSRMSARPKDRVEPPIGETSAPFMPVPATAPSESLASSPPAEALKTAVEPETPPAPSAAEAVSAAPPSPISNADPFEEEMARLLGRTPGKDA